MRLNPTKQSHIPPNIHKVMNHPQNINYRTPNFRFAGHTRLNYRQEGSLCLLDWLAPMTPQLQFANTILYHNLRRRGLSLSLSLRLDQKDSSHISSLVSLSETQRLATSLSNSDCQFKPATHRQQNIEPQLP